MKRECRHVQGVLARGQRELFTDELAHAVACAACARTKAELERLDEGLAALNAEPPPGLREATLRRLEEADRDASGPERPRWLEVGRPVWVGASVALLAVAVAWMAGLVQPKLPFMEEAASISPEVYEEVFYMPDSIDESEPAASKDEDRDGFRQLAKRKESKKNDGLDSGAFADEAFVRSERVPSDPDRFANEREERETELRRRDLSRAEKSRSRKQMEQEMRMQAKRAPENAPPPASPPAELDALDYMGDYRVEGQVASAEAPSHGALRGPAPSVREMEMELEEAVLGGARGFGLDGKARDAVSHERDEAPGLVLKAELARSPAAELKGSEQAVDDAPSRPARRSAGFELATGALAPTEEIAAGGGFAADEALADKEVGDRLPRAGRVAPAAGLDSLLARFGYGALDYQPEAWKHVSLDWPVYFENLYLGGNARLQYLDSLSEGLVLDGAPSLPHRLARLPDQLLDPPDRGGMALHVDLDRSFVPHGTRQRVFLQVGLKGSENVAWRRPPVSLAVLSLVETHHVLAATAARDALCGGLESRDLFVEVSAQGSLELRPPGSLPGPLQVVSSRGRELVQRLRALTVALEKAERTGSLRNRRLVILADVEIEDRVRDAVHRLALRDVAVSVISLAPEHRRSHARVAMEGQGNLQVASTVAGAGRAGEAELSSLTRIVGRALRLNIRPAPGVKLIQVVGSRPLDRRETRRVKAREEAIDEQVERTTGIASDRGADDPGLQTVIPYFYSGDEHVVLVELEVEGPGAVADVSLQYKDLVDMKNRRLRQSSSLARVSVARTLKQQQVRDNVLGFAVASVLRELEESIDSGGAPDLERVRRLAGSLASGDNRSMLEQYVELAAAGVPPARLARSLEHARRARLGRNE